MIPQAQLMDYFVEVTDTLVSDFDLVDFLHTLTVKAAEASGAAAVGLVLIDHHERVRYMASSNEEGKLLELLQIQNAEGPCLDAMLTGLPVVNADLGEAAARWPTFAPAARAAGFQSVHAFPLRLAARTIGALNIFGVDDARFAADEVRVVQALADVATIAILHERGERQTDVVTERLQAALHSRIMLEQAKGALSRSQSITTDQAFDLLLSTARATHQKLAEVARSVIVDLEMPPSAPIHSVELDVDRPTWRARSAAPPVQPSTGRPMLPFVWPYWRDGETIKACTECASWQLELFELPDSGAVWIREWHDAECPLLDRMHDESVARPGEAAGEQHP